MSFDLVPLKHGPSVPEEAIRLFLDLSDRGFVLRSEDGKLKLNSGVATAPLTDAERTAIVRYKFHLLGLVDYCASGVVDSA